MPIDKASFSRRLMLAMESQGKTVADIARYTGTSKTYAAGYIQGRYVPQRIRRRAITEALHLNTAWLIGGGQPQETQTRIPDRQADTNDPHPMQTGYGLAIVAYSDSLQPGSYFRTKDIRRATGLNASQMQYGLRSRVASSVNAMRVGKGVYLKR